MLNRVKHIFSALGILLLLSSCDATIHEYPSESSIILNVDCTLNDTQLEFFVNVECNVKTGTSYIVRTHGMRPEETRFDEPYRLRYIVDLYRVVASHSEFVERKVEIVDPNAEDYNKMPTVQFDVVASEYKVLVWCDYVRESAELEDWYYQTGDLRKILYNDIEVKDNNDKDVFTNMAHLNFRDYYYMSGKYEESVHLTLERPNGRYKCIAEDINEYLKKENVDKITSVVSYVQYVAAGYNVEDQKPNYFEPTRTYITTVSTDDLNQDGNLEMCYDYVFVNGKQSNVKINFQFYRGEVCMKDGELRRKIDDNTYELITEDDHISNWSGIVVPLKRNMETIINGKLLTASFGSGGIGIDPGFENEIVIPWE